jgi:hypothetical protein
MRAQPWRERREAYLRERGRLADLFREGYTESGLSVIQGGALPAVAPHPTLILITRSEKKALRQVEPVFQPVNEQQQGLLGAAPGR